MKCVSKIPAEHGDFPTSVVMARTEHAENQNSDGTPDTTGSRQSRLLLLQE